MLSVTHPRPNRLDIELSAVLDGDMMAAGLDSLIEKSQGIEDGVILYRIPSFSLPTGGAFVAEMLRLPQLFEVISHFRRCAVVTDYAWIQVAAKIEGALMPNLEIRCFDFSELEEAEAWLEMGDDAEADSDFEDNMPV